jgi:hypothetical protein
VQAYLSAWSLSQSMAVYLAPEPHLCVYLAPDQHLPVGLAPEPVHLAPPTCLSEP